MYSLTKHATQISIYPQPRAKRNRVQPQRNPVAICLGHDLYSNIPYSTHELNNFLTRSFIVVILYLPSRNDCSNFLGVRGESVSSSSSNEDSEGTVPFLGFFLTRSRSSFTKLLAMSIGGKEFCSGVQFGVTSFVVF